jgi:hypothetical protein
MYAIEAKNEKDFRWISGIFKEHVDAEAYYLTIPTPLRSSQSLIEVPFSTYPFYLTEDGGFQYLDIEGVKAKLEALEPVGNEDAILLNVYVVTEDFFSPIAGTDHMGALYHRHITDSSLGRKHRDAILRELLDAAGV